MRALHSEPSEPTSAIFVPSYYESDFLNLREIAKGGEATVWSGYHPRLGNVAIKRPKRLTIREVKTLNRCPIHPNIIQIYGFFATPQGYSGYVMEYFELGTLHNIIHNFTYQYANDLINKWVEQLAMGLQHLHEHNIIHRDVHPKNVLMVTMDHLQLADFGISRLIPSESEMPPELSYGAGTEIYRAPEVMWTTTYSLPADIYSLGITIWEITHRLHPQFQTQNMPLIISEEVDMDLQILMERCWHEKAAVRPSAAEIIDEIASKTNNTRACQSTEKPKNTSVIATTLTVARLIQSCSLPTLTMPRYYAKENFTGLQQVNAGGESTIWTGYHPHFGGVLVAAKILYYMTYFHEIDTMLKIPKHPYIMHIYGLLSSSENYIGYVMEYIKFGSLHDVIYTVENKYTEYEMWDWIRQIAMALQHLHRNGILHRDVKPKNILMINISHLKLADFGMSRHRESKIDDPLIMTSAVGTQHYMAPEIMSTNTYSFPADIFSLGVTIWEISHRLHPWHDVSLQKKPYIVNPKRVDVDLREMIERCLSDQFERPTAGDIVKQAARKTMDLLIKPIPHSSNCVK